MLGRHFNGLIVKYCQQIRNFSSSIKIVARVIYDLPLSHQFFILYYVLSAITFSCIPYVLYTYCVSVYIRAFAVPLHFYRSHAAANRIFSFTFSTLGALFFQFVTALLCILTTYCFFCSKIAISLPPSRSFSLAGSITSTTCAEVYRR